MFFALDARYTDGGGDGGVPPLTGSSTVVLQPKHKEAEHADSLAPAPRPARSPATSRAAAAPACSASTTGDWAAYEPINLTGIDSLTFRVASTPGRRRHRAAQGLADRRRARHRPGARTRAARAAGPT